MSDTSDIVRRIAARDYGAQDAAEAAGPSAAPAIAPLLADPDHRVRILAAHCLGLAGGPIALDALVGAARDANLSVSGAAISGIELQRLAGRPDATAKLLALLDAPLDHTVRRRIPTVLIRTGAPVTIEDLEPRAANEADPEVRLELLILLGNLGAPEAQKEIAERIEAARGPALVAWTRKLELVRGTWLVPALATWLSVNEPAARVGVDGVPHIPEYIRACDVAVNTLSAWIGVKPSFPLGPVTLYAPAQLDEMERLVTAWKAAARGSP